MQSLPIKSNLNLMELNDYLRNQVDPQLLNWDKQELFPTQVYLEMHRLGLIALSLPVSLGGTGAPMIDLLTVVEKLAYHSPAIASAWIGHVLFHTAISKFARPEIASKILGQHLSQKTLVSFCATEKETGFDLFKMGTTARRVEGGYRITGRKHFITNINYAQQLVVFARIMDTNGTLDSEMSAFYLPRNLPGISVGAPLSKLGQRESNTGSVEFNDVFVSEENLLGNAGQGGLILATCLSRTKTLIAGAASGICHRAEDEAVQYLSNTWRYGQPLLAKREIQTILSNQRINREAAWLFACRSGAVWDTKGIAVYESSMAKLFAADCAVQAVNEALELTGATGYMNESALSKLYRDVKVLEIYEGSTLVQQNIVGKELYGSTVKKALSAVNPPKKEVA